MRPYYEVFITTKDYQVRPISFSEFYHGAFAINQKTPFIQIYNIKYEASFLKRQSSQNTFEDQYIYANIGFLLNKLKIVLTDGSRYLQISYQIEQFITRAKFILLSYKKNKNFVTRYIFASLKVFILCLPFNKQIETVTFQCQIQSLLHYIITLVFCSFFHILKNAKLILKNTSLSHILHVIVRPMPCQIGLMVQSPGKPFSSHGAQGAKPNHAVVHSFICEILIGFLGEEILFLSIHRLLFIKQNGNILIFLEFRGGNLKGSLNLFYQIRLFLLYSHSIYHPKCSLPVRCIHGQ